MDIKVYDNRININCYCTVHYELNFHEVHKCSYKSCGCYYESRDTYIICPLIACIHRIRRKKGNEFELDGTAHDRCKDSLVVKCYNQYICTIDCYDLFIKLKYLQKLQPYLNDDILNYTVTQYCEKLTV
jgi:hypothetical protein